MARNPLTNLFKSAFSDALADDPEWEEMTRKWKKSRRRFIRNMSLAAGSMALIPAFFMKKQNPPEIVIVGAGMAGLNAAYQFRKKGIKTRVYEASGRTGGRMFTMQNQFGEGISTDIGGEFVDTSHADILQLAKEFNLDFYDLHEDKLSTKTFYFEGKHLDQSDLRAAIGPYAKQIMKDVLSLPPIIDHINASSFRHLDEQSITEYISALGIQGWLFDFLNVVLTREYGIEAKDQSAVNFLIMFVPPFDTEKDYQLFGTGHELFKIKGGSQRLTDLMFEKLKEQVTLNHRLTHLRQLESGKYEMVFIHQNEETAVTADYVLMTIPFSILRNISFTVPMSAEKRKCIDEIGYGNSCKFVLGVNQKPWRRLKQQGYTFTDLAFGAGWDSSQMQSADKGSFTVFGGGYFGDYLNQTKEAVLQETFSSALDIIYPGAEQVYSGKNIKFCWSAYPFTKVGYSVFKKGQWSTLSGWEAMPVGNIFFAGEHVSKEYQGYMNGAAETARVAVGAILQKINALSI
jgi:monoamine oxidase